MNIKSPLKKFFTVILWCLLGGSGLALLIAAINAKNSSLCNGVDIEINGGNNALFLNKKDLFETKLQHIALNKFFPKYDGKKK